MSISVSKSQRQLLRSVVKNNIYKEFGDSKRKMLDDLSTLGLVEIDEIGFIHVTEQGMSVLENARNQFLWH